MLRFLFFSAILGLVVSETPNPTVKVAQGLLQGSWRLSTKGRTFASFRGVPYAQPPVGQYRFKEPQERKPWPGVWNATRLQPVCLQYDAYANEIAGSEDCLYVNVHTPKLQSDALLPVMVFIHGGAFMYGGGTLYDATNIMDWDMVVVTLNYRLGPLGFLSTEDTVVPGNNGLKDQSFALHWIKNNIKAFGGDPNSITLTGCSAGGASVHYHYLSPLSRGTFARGIAFSGAALTSWAQSIRPLEKTNELATIVGCPTGDSKVLVECLRERPADTIVKAQFEMFEWKVYFFTVFTPVVEAPATEKPFLSVDPYTATKNGAMMKVPLITAVTSEEGLYPAAAYQVDPPLLPDLEENWDELASNIFIFNDTLPRAEHAKVAQAIKKQYLGGRPVSQETFPELVQALGDRLFVVHVGKNAQFHAANSGQPTYVYRYAYRGSMSMSSLMTFNDAYYGVAHADDVIRIFKYPELDVKTDEDRTMIDELINMVYSYSTTGKPKLTENGPEWHPVKPGASELDYLDILSPSQFEMKSTTDFGQKSFWDNLGFNEHENFNKKLREEL